MEMKNGNLMDLKKSDFEKGMHHHKVSYPQWKFVAKDSDYLGLWSLSINRQIMYKFTLKYNTAPLTFVVSLPQTPTLKTLVVRGTLRYHQQNCYNGFCCDFAFF